MSDSNLVNIPSPHSETSKNHSENWISMKIHEKIRFIRQSKGFTQEYVAEQLGLSVNGYSNIERGETDIQFSRLEKIAHIFGVTINDIINYGETKIIYNIHHSPHNNHYIEQRHNFFCNATSSHLPELYELETLQLLLKQKDKEIEYLKEIINLLKNNA